MAEDENKKYRVFISAAEASGDAHCGNLIKALKQSGCEIEFVGVGGEKMAEAGCELFDNTVNKAAMTYNAFKHVFSYYLLIRRINQYLQTNHVDLVIVCDSPAFNFHVAEAGEKAGVKTLFYVAPQLWAWAAWRIKKLRKYCDKLCCILPFEEEWFGERGVDAVFVGNPMLDELEAKLGKFKKTYADFDPANVHIALMPGSRDAEINTLWPAMQKIAVMLKKKYPNIAVTSVAVDDKKKEVLRSMQILGFKCQYSIGSVTETARAVDFSLVASGSATLQVAAAGCPMVIMYQSSRILWHLVGRWLVKTKFLSLVNILAQRRLVGEFMPYFNSVAPIAEAVEKLLEEKNQLKQISGELIELVDSVRKDNASEKVAKIASEMLGL